jgi:hypothetical protein
MSELAIIAIGIVIQSATFALGILVGASLRRRGHDDGNGYEKAKEFWHLAGNGDAQGGSRGRGGSGADSTGEADARIRAAWRRHIDSH